MSIKQETGLSRACIQWVEDNGGKVLKIHGNEFQEAGTPDHMGSIEVADNSEYTFGTRWVHYFIELKNPGEEPSKIQEWQLKEWGARGFKTGCAHTLEEYIDIILRS